MKFRALLVLVVSGFAATAVAALSVGARHPEPSGDVNCDGPTNSVDAALVLQLDARLTRSLACVQNADVDEDGAISSIDASLILQHDAGFWRRWSRRPIATLPPGSIPDNRPTAPSSSPTTPPQPTASPVPVLTVTPTPTSSPLPTPTSTPTPVADSAGQLKVRIYHNSAFDVFTQDETYADVINSRYDGMLVHEPYFDSRLSWYDGTAMFYKDAYAIYVDAAWNRDGASLDSVLRDSAGDPCYIPWGSPYPQYAADIGNQRFRDNWIDFVVSKFQDVPGYAGVWIDDVNLDLSRVSCGNADGLGNSHAPIDPRTGQVMTNEDWRRYFAEFLEQVREALPGKLIAHNTIWYLVPFDDPILARQIQAADFVEMEQGFIDRGLTGGTGTYSWTRKVAFVDLVHSNGRQVIDRDEDAANVGEQIYGLANFWLINDGGDLYGAEYRVRPTEWSTMYETDLGPALNQRYLWDGVWRRDFADGFVLVNPSGGTSKSLDLGATYMGIDGTGAGFVNLNEEQGAVFLTPS